MHPGEAGLRQARTSWGLRLARPGFATGCVPRSSGVLLKSGAFGVYMTIGPTRVGRPLSFAGSEGQVCFSDRGRVPDDAGGVVIVPGFDVADRIALRGEGGVVVVCVDVRGDGAVREVCHVDVPFLHQPDC